MRPVERGLCEAESCVSKLQETVSNNKSRARGLLFYSCLDVVKESGCCHV